MRNLSLPIVSLALFAVTARAEDTIPPEMVAAIKAATVYVKVEAEGLSGSGSGFVIKTEGDNAYVVTNHHVVEPKSVQVVVVPERRPSSPYRSHGSHRSHGLSPFPSTPFPPRPARK